MYAIIANFHVGLMFHRALNTLDRSMLPKQIEYPSHVHNLQMIVIINEQLNPFCTPICYIMENQCAPRIFSNLVCIRQSAIFMALINVVWAASFSDQGFVVAMLVEGENIGNPLLLGNSYLKIQFDLIISIKDIPLVHPIKSRKINNETI